MLKNLRRLALLTLLIGPGLAKGQEPSAILDTAAMFSDPAIREAKAELVRIDRAHGLTVTIETIESLKGQEIDIVAVREAERIGHKGIFVLIARRDHKVEVLASPRAVREELGTSRLNTIRDAFLEQFRKDQVDAGLVKGTQAAGVAIASVRPARKPEPSTPVGGSSIGSTSALIAREQVRLTLAGARRAMAGAESRALEKGYKMNIAAVDDGGHLMTFVRMDGARPGSAHSAISKAETLANDRQTTSPTGGILIVVDGQVIGALGVGGGSVEQDAEIAKAGLDAFLTGLQEAARPLDEKARPADLETSPK